jgi:hypothetical protein
LLNDDDRLSIDHTQVPTARGAGVQDVVGGVSSEHLGREQLALVRGMPRLAAGLAPGLAGRGRRLGWLGDVRGGGLGRIGGILEGCGELSVQLLDGGPDGDDLSPQDVDLGL